MMDMTTEQIKNLPTIGVWSDGLMGVEVKKIEDDLITVVVHDREVIVTELLWDIEDEEADDWFIEIYGRRYYGNECMRV